MKLITAVAAAALATVISTTVAEAQTTMYACYVKNTGTVYRIKTAGTPTKCSTNHTEFSWNMEGQVGPEGPQGPVGPAAPSGITGYAIRTASSAVAGGTMGGARVECLAGEVVLGGGFTSSTPMPSTSIQANYPWLDNEDGIYSWTVSIHNNTPGTNPTVVVFAICAKKAAS